MCTLFTIIHNRRRRCRRHECVSRTHTRIAQIQRAQAIRILSNAGMFASRKCIRVVVFQLLR